MFVTTDKQLFGKKPTNINFCYSLPCVELNSFDFFKKLTTKQNLRPCLLLLSK